MSIQLRDFADVETTRQTIYENIMEGFKKSFPKDGKFVRLKIEDLQIPFDKRFSKEEQKKYILQDKDLTVPIKGKLILEDKTTGKVLDEKKATLGQILYMTPKRGTFIGNGVEYIVSNQMRLMPGVYTRIKENSDIESQFNTEGKVGFRVMMEPSTGKFKMVVGTNKLPLYPILKAFNVPDEQLKSNWGDKLFEVNKKENDTTTIPKLYKKLEGYYADPNANYHEKSQKIIEEFKGLKLNPDVTRLTLGDGYSKVTPKSILDSTKKILSVFKGESEPDDRDSLIFKTFHGVEDFLKERIEKDSGHVAKKLMYKLDKEKNLQKFPTGIFSKYFKELVRGDNRSFPLEEINPIDIFDSKHKVIITGDGGVKSLDIITPDARNVNASQFGFVDPIRGPENEKIGIDTRLSYNTFKGNDKKIYSKFFRADNNKEVYLSPDYVYKNKVAFPGEMEKNSQYARVIYKGEFKTVPKKDVNYYIKDGSELFSTYSILIPMISGVSGNRTLMAGKALPDTLPFAEQESPIVRTKKFDEKDNDFETYFGNTILSEKSPIDGTIEKITPNEIIISDGNKKVKVDLYDNFPLSRKTYLKNIPTVSVGDKIKKDQIIARTNYSDKNGTLASGKHLLTAYMPYKGLNFEDGIPISESAAKKLTTEEMYKIEVPIDENTKINKNDFISSFPSIYTRDKISPFDENGIIKKGTKVNLGDPLVLALRQKTMSAQDIALGKLHKVLKNINDDASATWEHHDEGEVSDTVITKDKAKVYVKVKTPAKVGDKLTGRFGNKGVISAIIPDNEMPVMERTGERIEMILNPLGIVSRTNPSQVSEGLLGKIGKEKNKIFRTQFFLNRKSELGNEDPTYLDILKKELKDNNIPVKENLKDNKGNNLKATVIYPYFYRLSKMAEAQFSAREFGGYTSNAQPVKGSDEKAIKIGTMELEALKGHGAINNMKEMSTIKGNRNDAFWRNLKLGYPLPSPEVPFVFEKFINLLKAGGINVKKTGDIMSIMPLTDKETESISKGEITENRFINAKKMEPEKNGFFDIGLTGGTTGKFWTHMNLSTPMPNPIMEKPIKVILGLDEKKFNAIMTGKDKIDGKMGGEAFKQALSKINVDNEIKDSLEKLKTVKKSEKDNLIKKLNYLKGIKSSGINISDLIINKIPVLPPVFRPISGMPGSNTIIISDPNKLYQDLFYSNDALKELKKDLPEESLGEERMNLYNVLKATFGTGKHVNAELEKTGVKSFIGSIVGDIPKKGFFFDKVVSKTQDLVGRGVAVPDSSLGLDEIGLPEEMIWKIYRPFIMRSMIRSGVPAIRADEEINKRTAMAKSHFDMVIKDRPVIMNRAPSLHKFNMMGFFPKPMSHMAIATNPLITKPYNLDHDGDALQIHVPVTEEARLEVIEKMLPSKNVRSIKDYSIHYLPRQEDNYGLYIASTATKNNTPVKVKNMAELELLLKTKKINYDTVIDLQSED